MDSFDAGAAVNPQGESRQTDSQVAASSQVGNGTKPTIDPETTETASSEEKLNPDTLQMGESSTNYDSSPIALDQGEEILLPREREFRWVDPRTILPSPFGNDINPPASPAEDEALEKSVDEDGVQNPLICKETDGDKVQCLAGNRRLSFALKTGKKLVPVFIVKFDSEEAERQFAIKDNIERRQFSRIDKAKLALLLWMSFRKSSTEKGKARDTSAREKAANAAAISTGTLFNYKFVLDHGDQETIDDMHSEKVSIGAAYAKTKAMIDGPDKDTPATRSVRVNQLFKTMKGQMLVLKALPRLIKQLESLSKTAAKCRAAEKERLRKHLVGAQEVLVKLQSDDVIKNVLDAIANVESELAG